MAGEAKREAWSKKAIGARAQGGTLVANVGEEAISPLAARSVALSTVSSTDWLSRCLWCSLCARKSSRR